MRINNIINSPTNSIGWTSFTTTVTAIPTPPTFGAGSTIKSYYLMQGKNLFLTLSVTTVASGSSNGNGTYLFNLPSGFTMNTSIVTFPLSNYSLGSAAAYAQVNGDQGFGVAIANDTTHYILYVYADIGATSNFVSSTWFQAGAGCNYGAILQIPIS